MWHINFSKYQCDVVLRPIQAEFSYQEFGGDGGVLTPGRTAAKQTSVWDCIRDSRFIYITFVTIRTFTEIFVETKTGCFCMLWLDGSQPCFCCENQQIFKRGDVRTFGSCVSGDMTRSVKPKHDLFLSPYQVVCVTKLMWTWSTEMWSFYVTYLTYFNILQYQHWYLPLSCLFCRHLEVRTQRK